MRSLRIGRSRSLLALSAVAALTLLAGCGGGDDAARTAESGLATEAPRADLVVDGQFYRPEVLRFASISGADEESSAARLEPIVEYLSSKLDMEIEFVETTDYSSVIEAMRAGRVDLASYGPFSYVIASTEANATSLVAQPDQDSGDLGYKSLIITQADSPARTLQDLRGKSMAFGDPASTSGYLFPQLILSQAGIDDPDAFFSETSFSGGHDASLVAVTNGTVDAAGVCNTCIERYFREGLAEPDAIKVLAESETIPPSPVSARADLDPELRRAITDAYIALVTEQPEIVQQADSLDELPTHPYVEIADSEYDVIRDLAEALQIDLAELDG